ncbi:L,D-transpeptidase [Actinomadura rugatobispora]|uniref:Ig-like domain-containing protein n=1 Tax=Actinomadura rugatobispora TaxID=1994 RepID=A0ABW1AJV1_9ACTN
MRPKADGRFGIEARAAAVGLAAAVVGAGAAGCTSGADTMVTGADAVTVAVSPAQGAQRPRPDSPIAVQARQGTIENVTVFTKGEPVEGALSADRTQWRSRWALRPGTEYRVAATALGRDGRTRTVASRFTTAKADRTVGVTFEGPSDKEVVGVGMPIVMNFESEVSDRAAVERALEVRSSRPVEGAWHWFDNQTVVFRTRNFWPRHTDVAFRAHLSGVAVAKGVYGGKDHAVRFRVGDERISTASEDKHQMVVRENGRVVRKMPISMGRGGVRKYTTTNGMHLTMDKGNPVTMTSSWEGIGPGSAGYYSLTVDNAVRISDSGEYVHSAPWSVGSQGSSNVSHGCINTSPSHARWFYEFSQRGDPFEVTGSSRELEPDNGWGYWQMNWKNWVQGSALKQSMRIGPQGGVGLPAQHASPGAVAEEQRP